MLEEEEKRLNIFIAEQLEGDVSIWEPLQKTKLPTFNSNIKSYKMNIHVVKFKDERNFMSRLIIAAKSRPEIDVSKYLIEYEFSSVAKSLFSAVGNLLKTTDKHVMLQKLEKSFPWTNQIL